MSDVYINESISLLHRNDVMDISCFFGEIEESDILRAETYLDVRFPSDYRIFLGMFGAGSVGSSEIYGLTNSDFEAAGIPNMVWCTLQDRKRGLASNLIRIGDGGLTSPYILLSDCFSRSPVVSCIFTGNEFNVVESISESFGQYLLDILKKEISYLG